MMTSLSVPNFRFRTFQVSLYSLFKHIPQNSPRIDFTLGEYMCHRVWLYNTLLLFWGRSCKITVGVLGGLFSVGAWS